MQAIFLGTVLGVRVGDDLTPKEMQIAAGLDWSVQKEPMFVGDQRVPGKQALVRSSDNRILDVVGDQWISCSKTTTPSTSLTTMSKLVVWKCIPLVHFRMVRLCGALAKVNETFTLFGGKDEVDSYLLLF